MIQAHVQVRSRALEVQGRIRAALDSAAVKMQLLARQKANSAIGGQTGRNVGNSVRTTPTGIYTNDKIAVHKERGGTIRAKSGKLAIPLVRGWQGKGFWITSKRGNLVMLDTITKTPVIVLKESVTQRAYPWFPTQAEVNQLLRAEINQKVQG